MEMAGMRRVKQRMPFLSIVIQTVDRREITVLHPDFISVTYEGRLVTVTVPESGRTILLDVMLIVSVEFTDPLTEEEDLPPELPTPSEGETP